MAKRSSEPVEAIGPAVNGLEAFPVAAVQPVEEALPEPELPADEPEVSEELEDPVALLCGCGNVARAVASLASACGFTVEFAVETEEGSTDLQTGGKLHVVPGWHNFVETCEVGPNCFIGIFLENEDECVDILLQCLPSQARYLGVLGDQETRTGVFGKLREAGAPDAELAAIACPMGLNIGANTAEQKAVGIVAELMAARAGTLKRLRYGEYRPRSGRSLS